jgi:hypothetical protein
MLNPRLPLLGATSREVDREEVVHRQTDAPADEWEDEPEELRDQQQVDHHQRDVDHHIDPRMHVEAGAPLLSAQLGLGLLVIRERDAVHHVRASVLGV